MEPGWHPNPDNPKQLRYHDGTEWTSHTAAKKQSRLKSNLMLIFGSLATVLLAGAVLLFVSVKGYQQEEKARDAQVAQTLGPELTDPNYEFTGLEAERLEQVTQINTTLYGEELGPRLARVTTRVRAFKENNPDYSTFFEDPKDYTQQEYRESGWFLIETAYKTEGFSFNDMTKYAQVTQNAIMILEEPPKNYDPQMCLHRESPGAEMVEIDCDDSVFADGSSGSSSFSTDKNYSSRY